MKTIRQILLLALGLLALTATAGDDDAVIRDIRAAYAQAHADIKAAGKSKTTRNDMVCTLRYQVPGKGTADEKISFYSRLEQFGDSGQYVNYSLYFVTRQLKVGGRKYYEEYLFNRHSTPIFVYKRDYDAHGKEVDKRFYYNDERLYRTMGPMEQYDGEATYFQARDYRQAFDNLIGNAKE